jgi:hypothetical protein
MSIPKIRFKRCLLHRYPHISMKYCLTSSILLFFACLFYTCTYHKGGIEPALDCTPKITTVSFATDINPILTANCATSGCHSGTTPEGNLNLEAARAYDALQKRGSGYIDTINPQSSVLYSSLVSISDPMPPNGQLSPCDLKRIEMWMKQGAKNN